MTGGREREYLTAKGWHVVPGEREYLTVTGWHMVPGGRENR